MNGHFDGPISLQAIADRKLLTCAEMDVLFRVLEGRSNSDIATERATSVRTVANQIAKIFRKLGVRSRRELAAHSSSLRREDATCSAGLTPRERVVFDRAMRGWSDKQIADSLGASTGAIGALLTKARRKLQLSTGVLAPGRHSVGEDSAAGIVGK